MADVEVVIKLTDNYYKHVVDYKVNLPTQILEAIRHGVVLPKWHGNLKDEDEIYELLNSVNGTAELDKAFEAVEQATTIIKADKGDEDEYRN